MQFELTGKEVKGILWKRKRQEMKLGKWMLWVLIAIMGVECLVVFVSFWLGASVMVVLFFLALILRVKRDRIERLQVETEFARLLKGG